LLILLNAEAGELIVHNGGTVTIKSGSVLLMKCSDLTIENGGIFTVEGGAVLQRGKLRVEAGGHYTVESGKVEQCRAFYVIPGAEGQGAVIYL
jgi:hypothetical protein